MSQQHSLQEALPSAINLKNIALSRHASSRESEKKIFGDFLLSFAKQYFQCLCPSYPKVSKMSSFKRDLLKKSVIESHLVFPNFQLSMTQKTQNTCWFWQGQSRVRKIKCFFARRRHGLGWGFAGIRSKAGPSDPEGASVSSADKRGLLGIMCNEQRGAWGPITFVRAWKGLIRAPSGAVGQKAREGDGKKHAAGDRGEGSVWRSPERRWPRGGGHSDSCHMPPGGDGAAAGGLALGYYFEEFFINHCKKQC